MRVAADRLLPNDLPKIYNSLRCDLTTVERTNYVRKKEKFVHDEFCVFELTKIHVKNMLQNADFDFKSQGEKKFCFFSLFALYDSDSKTRM